MISVPLPSRPSTAGDRPRLWPAIALIIVPFLGLIALQGYQLLNLGPRADLSQRLVSHSIEVILTAHSLRSALQSAESAQRGYLLTGRAAYLAPYDAATRDIPQLLQRLKELTAGDPDQQRQIAAISQAIGMKLAELRQTIEAYRTSGFAAARRIVESNTGLHAMASIEVGIDTLIGTESSHRSRRLAALVAQEHLDARTTMASGLLVLTLMLSGLVLTLQSFRKARRLQWEIQQRAEEAAHANRQLEQRNLDLARAGELARAAKEESRRAEQAKGRFLATASHDLRQPLQAVSLLNGTLRRMVKDPQTIEALRQQDEGIAVMSKLLNALLDISKLEAGVIEPQPRTVPVSQVLTAMEQEFRGMAGSKGLELQVISCAAYVHTDPALFEQILRNLVANAIKYTRAGCIRLRAVAEPPWVDIEVVDTGIGIPADQLQLIGEEFYQIGVPSNSTREGYGLGMSIVRRLIKLLGLELRIASQVGQGSTFCVRLRQSVEAPTPERPRVEPVGNQDQPDVDARILLVEDDPDVCKATRMLLGTEGYRVTTAASLAEAIQGLQEDRSVDLLVTDFHLAAGETGVQVISRLREELGATLKAILITGDTSSAVKELAHDPNLRIVSKPVQAEAFLGLVRQLLTG